LPVLFPRYTNIIDIISENTIWNSRKMPPISVSFFSSGQLPAYSASQGFPALLKLLDKKENFAIIKLHYHTRYAVLFVISV